MFVVYWLVGFFINLIGMLINTIPMCITCGNICANRSRFPWDIDDEEYLEALEQDESLKDD